MRTLLTILFLLVSLSMPWQLIAQDKEAKRILDKLHQRYEGYKTLEINFRLTIDYPDRETQIQEGILVQDGKKFLYKTPDQEMYGDGRDVWLYLKERNEVQINNYDEDDESLSLVTPKDFLKQYNTGQFAYQISQKNDLLVEIEFKPVDQDSEYAKFKLKLDRKKNEIDQVEGLGKDGSKLIFKLLSLSPNKAYAPGTFIFNPAKYPGVLIEDLRID